MNNLISLASICCFLFFLVGCEKIENRKQEWRCKINGVQCEWKGMQDEVFGSCRFKNPYPTRSEISLSGAYGDEWVGLEFLLPDLNVGTKIMYCPPNWCLFTFLYRSNDGASSCENGYNMRIDITESTPTRVKGTFSGTLYKEPGYQRPPGVLKITDGYFEAIIDE